MKKNKLIISNKNIKGGQPVIAGTRITIANIISLVKKQSIDPKVLVTEYFTHISLDQVLESLKWNKSKGNCYG